MSQSGGPNLQLCNLFARQQGLDPIGFAGTLDAFLVFEVPLPWPRGVFESRKLPPEIREAIAWHTRELPMRLRPLIIGPDREYGQPGSRRVMWLSRPSGPISGYERAEYLVPATEMGELVATLVRQAGKADRFEEYRVESSSRDLLVCTHGSQDAACGRFGVPLYNRLRERAAGPERRVWRVSHFGGHVFAPTALELPSGRFWAYLEDEDSEALFEGRGDAELLRGNYRGWAALESPFIQALERELLVREGWNWLELPKTGRTIAEDPADEPRWATVELTAWRDGAPLTYRARVEIVRTLPIRPRSDSSEEKPYPQYQVTSLDVAAPGEPTAVAS